MNLFHRMNWLGVLTWMLLAGYAVPGAALELDATFGQDGIVTTRVGYYEDRGQAVAVQADGKIVVVGSSSNNVNLDLAVVRYNPDGSLDLDFNGTGQVVTAVGNGDDQGFGIALQQDDKIVVCGRTFNGTDNDMVLLRLLDDGSYDPDFGVNGVVTLAPGSGEESATAVAVQDDGRILVAGMMTENGQQTGVLLRLLANGFVDPSFGVKGRVMIRAGSSAAFTDMAIQSDQGIVLSGNYEQDGQSGILITRLLTNGSVDTAFGKNGEAIIGVKSTAINGNSLWIQDDGAILVAGSVGLEGARDIALFRLTSAGLPDLSFGDSGMLRYGVAGVDEIANDVLVAGEKIFVTGSVMEDGNKHLILLESPVAGSQALSVVQPQGGKREGEALALALQPDAKIVAAGFSEESGTSSISLARYATTAESATAKSADSTDSGSKYIQTTIPAEITRVGCVTGGEILTGSGLTFIVRGIVYSIAPYPSLPADQATTTTSTTTTTVSTSTTTQVDAAKEGFTSNGRGEGRFGVALDKLSPGTRYYVRAYGVTDTDEVLYGSQHSFMTSDSCFIATAAYGSLLDPHVQVLRQFRDRYLLECAAGRLFVGYYYKYSPPLADFIANSSVLRFVVRLTLLPLIVGGYIVLHWGIAGFLLTLVLMSGAAMVIRSFWYSSRRAKGV